MMKTNKTNLGLIGASVMALGLSGVLSESISAQPSGEALLTSLSKGEWTVRFRGAIPERKICVRSGEELVRLQHAGVQCKRLSIEDGTAELTVNYNCPGNGYGRTSIRRETAALVQIESQGFARGRPFQWRAEARKTGSCR